METENTEAPRPDDQDPEPTEEGSPVPDPGENGGDAGDVPNAD